jgi:hypothetical protein
MAFLGVQEAVSSNLAVPTFKINNLRAPFWCPFCFGATFRATFDPNFYFELATPHWS